MTPRRPQPDGTCGVEGQGTDRVPWADGRPVHGDERREGAWPWRAPPWEPRGRAGRLPAPSPTDGVVPGVRVAEPGQERCALRGGETTRRGPVVRRRGRRRHGRAWVGRVLQPLWAPEAWHVPREEADEGPLVRRRMARGGGFDPSRVLGKGRLTMEARTGGKLLVVDGDPLRDIGLLAQHGGKLPLIMLAGQIVKNRLS